MWITRCNTNLFGWSGLRTNLKLTLTIAGCVVLVLIVKKAVILHLATRLFNEMLGTGVVS